MSFAKQPVRVETGTRDEEGCLIFAEGRLVAVLVRLSDQHDSLAGQWFLEVGFGPIDGPQHPTFGDLEAAEAWIARRLAQRRGPEVT
jgi:hypothetical protein